MVATWNTELLQHIKVDVMDCRNIVDVCILDVIIIMYYIAELVRRCVLRNCCIHDILFVSM